MPVLKTKEQVNSILLTKIGGNKPIIFGSEIEKMQSGQGLYFEEKEWPIKTNPANYFWGKYSKNKEVKTISISKVEGGYLITKL